MMTTINFTRMIGGVIIYCCLGLTSCFTPHTAFNHPHDLKNIRSTVELTDNTELSGYLSFSHTSAYATLYSPAHGKSLKINSEDIIAIKTDMGHFERKVLDRHYGLEANKPRHAAFVKRITDENAFVNIYEHKESVSNPKSALITYTKRYYITLPGDQSNRIWDLDGGEFRSEFNQKMEELFAADTRLVSLIQQKDDKYYCKKFSLRSNNKVRVILNLNRDYEASGGTLTTGN